MTGATRGLLVAAAAGGAVALLPLAVVLGDVGRALAGPRGPEVLASAGSLLAHPATLRSLVLASIAAGLAALLGWPVAKVLASAPQAKARRVLRALVAILAFAPAACPAAAIGGALADLSGLGPAPGTGLASDALRGAALAFAWAAALAPLAAIGWTIALLDAPRAESDAARLLLGPRARLRHVTWPRFRGAFALSAGAVAALAFTDAATPPHFGVDTFASLLAYRFQTTLDEAGCAAAALPLWIAIAAAVAWLAARSHGRSAPARRTGPGRGALAAAFASVVLITILPAVWCAVHALEGGPASSALRQHLPELLASLRTALAGALAGAAIAIATIAFRSCSRTARPWPDSRLARAAHALLVFALVLPIATSGVVYGFGWTGAAVLAGPAADEPASWLALIGRCAPWALLAAVLLAPSRPALAAHALALGPRTRFALALGERGGVAATIAASATAAAALREVELSAAAGRPGTETLAVRAAQLLHFGFDGRVAALTLAHFGFGAVLALAGVAASALGRRSASGEP